MNTINPTQKNPNWSAMGSRLSAMIPMTTMGSSTWLHPVLNNGVVKGGYKLHIPFNDSENGNDFADMVVEIYSLGVNFKVCQNINVLNNNATQKGKHLVLYPESLCFLSHLSEKSKEILMTDCDTIVPNEERIAGTRIFTRFCNFYDGSFFNFDNWKFETASRGDSIPNFAKIPSLNLFERSSFDKFEGKQISDVLSIAAKTYKLYQDKGETENCNKILGMYKSHFEKLWELVVNNKVPICCINYGLLVSLAILYGEISE